MYIILQILLIGPAAAARERALGRLRAAGREQRAGAEGVAPVPRRLRTGLKYSFGTNKYCHQIRIRGESARQSKVEKHNQKAPEDVTFIREKTYTLPITLASRLEVRKPRFYQQSSAMLIMLAVAEHPSPLVF